MTAMGFLLLLSNCQKKNTPMTLSNHDAILNQKVDSVLNLMTLEEKVGQMNQYNGFWDLTGPKPKDGDAAKKYDDLKKGKVGSMLNVRGVEQVRAIQKIAVEETRLGIPLIFGFDVIHGFKTISPIPLAEAASWDLEAIQKSAEIAAAEAAASGLNWTFAPMVDISRDARWGRVMEGAGEDPYLGSLIAKARIQGFQGNDLANEFTVAACAKHFVGYGFPMAGRDYNTVDVSENLLHNVLLPPFKASVDAGVSTFMNAFNELNGIPATAHVDIQRNILKKEWNFQGFMVSDWGSIEELIYHGYAENLKDAAHKAILAGSDMDMESYAYVEYLVKLVNDKIVAESLIDDAVRRILKLKFRLGLFDNPYLYCDELREKETIGKPEFLAASLDMAKKSIVLLKNENQLLPLPKSGKKIAIIGDLAQDKTSPLGSWRIAADDETAISVWEGFQIYNQNVYSYARGAKLHTGRTQFVWETPINTTDKSEFPHAVQMAKNADVVIIVLGEHGLQSGEGRSRTELGLPGVQQDLLEEIYKVNQKVVLILANGRPLTIPWAAQHIPAILETWQLGTQSGHAIAQVVYGDYNPSGKLPMTFPRNVGQVPIYYNQKNTGRPAPEEKDNVFWSHYIDQENSPQYPFGFGLSYTNFEYSNLKLSSNSMQENGQIKASITLKNTGSRNGKEVVQWYIQDVVASVTRPTKELKGFEMVALNAGESKTVSLNIKPDLLAFYSANRIWETEKGVFKIKVGGSSDTVLETQFTYQ